MSTERRPTDHDRYYAALWYAWGQQDAGVGRHVGAHEFAVHHAAEAIAYEAARDYRTSSGPSHLASVTDAWRDYCAAHEGTPTP